MKPNRLAAKRRECGLTQKEVSDFIGIKYETYRMKESGKSSFTDVEKRKLKELLKMTEEDYNTILYNGVLPIKGDQFFASVVPIGKENSHDWIIPENGVGLNGS